MAETARQIISLAMKEAGILGVGQSLLAEDISDGYTYLTRMMKAWQKKRWLVPALTTINALGDGAQTHSVGPGGYFSYTARPDKIQSAYFVQVNTGSNPVSLPLTDLFSKENYDRIALKTLNTFPTHFFYDNMWANGLGNIYIWPIPSAVYRIYLTIKTDLGFPTDVDSVFDLPEEYLEAIHYNLAIRLCSAYQVQPEPSTMKLAKSSLNTIRVANTQVPTLIMPQALQGPRGFNIYNPDGY